MVWPWLVLFLPKIVNKDNEIILSQVVNRVDIAWEWILCRNQMAAQIVIYIKSVLFFILVYQYIMSIEDTAALRQGELKT